MHGFRANGNVLITSYRRYHARRRLFHIARGMEGVGRDSLCGKVLLLGKLIRAGRDCARTSLALHMHMHAISFDQAATVQHDHKLV